VDTSLDVDVTPEELRTWRAERDSNVRKPLLASVRDKDSIALLEVQELWSRYNRLINTLDRKYRRIQVAKDWLND